MDKKDFPDEEYFFVPIKKKTMLRFMLLFPDASESEFVVAPDAFFDGALDIIKAGRERRAAAQTQSSQQKIDRATGEERYLKCQIDDETKELYR